MSHLGQRLSALIDGELGPAERDRVLAHLARCDACRQEAVALRALKQRMHSLGEAMVDSALTGRLMAMAASGGPGERGPAWRPRALYAAARWLAAGLVASAMATVGAAAFMVGGEQQDPGPKVTPAVDSFLVQHEIVTGDMPVAPAAAASPAQPGAAPSPAARAGRRAAAVPSTGPSATAVPAAAVAGGGHPRTASRATRVRASTTPSARQRILARNVLLRPAGAGLAVAVASPGP
jgi:Putative zinc-finger